MFTVYVMSENTMKVFSNLETVLCIFCSVYFVFFYIKRIWIKYWKISFGVKCYTLSIL